ncbi:hypothetical protein LTS18_014264, partial [Coniosporium uncinatum]
RTDSPFDNVEGLTPGKPVPNIWTVIQSWIMALPTASEAQKQRRDRLRKELKWVLTKLGDCSGVGEEPFVYGHCDLLSGNVIIQPYATTNSNDASNAADGEACKGVAESCEVSFIDYEYSTPAPAAFDIANHFAEWGGFDCDYNKIPTRQQRLDFLRAYATSYNKHLDRPAARVDADVETLHAEIDAFRGIPGFYWGIWALIQATISDIDFDYASYAEVRLGEYWAWKAEFEGTRGQEEELCLRERRWA